MFKKFITKRLEKRTKQYFATHPDVKLVVVTGSIGKTSTKQAVATLLAEKLRVAMDNDDHNTHLAVPLSILGIRSPGKSRNPFAWLAVLKAAKLRVKAPATVDVIIQELSSYGPGYLKSFGSYLAPDITIVTSVTSSYMKLFGSLEKLAEEQLSFTEFSKYTLINRDDIDGQFAKYQLSNNFSTYGTTGTAEYRTEIQSFDAEHGCEAEFYAPGSDSSLPIRVKLYGEHSIRPVTAALAVALQLGLSSDDIDRGLAKVRPVPGRMNLLRGIDGAWIIDDSYDSSPLSANSALQTLYTFGGNDVPQRLLVFGDMSELGDSSADEHKRFGEICDPDLLDWVVLLGDQTEKYLAPAAKARGCQVYQAKDALDAGRFVRSVTRPGALILVKGPYEGAYLEECVKMLCNMTEDDELVRQGEQWAAVKDQMFSKFD